LPTVAFSRAAKIRPLIASSAWAAKAKDLEGVLATMPMTS
jgi:hypothetical protein